MKCDSGLAKWQRKFVHSSREKVLIVDLRFMEEVAEGLVRELLSPVPPSLLLNYVNTFLPDVIGW